MTDPKKLNLTINGQRHPFFSHLISEIKILAESPKTIKASVIVDATEVISELDHIKSLSTLDYNMTIDPDDSDIEYIVSSVDVDIDPNNPDSPNICISITGSKEEDFSSSKTLVDSKLYKLARTTQLAEHLEPDIDAKIKTEFFINNEQPRVDDDGQDTRIFIVFTSVKGNSTLVKMTDTKRLSNQFNIDKHLAQYQNTLFPPETLPTQDPVMVINGVISAAIEYLSMVLIGLEEVAGDNLNIANLIIPSIISIVYNDPLDVFVSLVEQPNGEIRLKNMWAVKIRNEG